MPRVTFAPAAVRDLERLRAFLEETNPSAAKRAGDAIVQGVRILETHPKLGRPIEDLPDQFRDWLIRFGQGGYVVRYRFDGETVVVLAVRHWREAGFKD